MYNIYRKSLVGTIEDGGTQPFEVVALGMITDALAAESAVDRKHKPIREPHRMNEVFEVIGPDGRAVSVRLGDSAYDDDGGPLNIQWRQNQQNLAEPMEA